MSASVERVLEKLGIKARLQGTRWWAETCPLPTHSQQNEKHRWKNFFIRSDGTKVAGLWTCFSCGKGGKLVELVMRVRELEFREALAWLKDVEEAPAREPVVRVRYEPLGTRGRFRMPDGVEHGPLGDWNSVARDYALSRGLDAEQVERWGIGYSLMGRLAGRIVFPIHDSTGKLVNYAARTFVGDETRYLAGDERRDHPDVAAMLGERFWPRTGRKDATAVVFEGALSGMALDRALRKIGANVFLAGLQGSNASDPRRIARLATFGRIVSAADPDAAGDRASEDLRAAFRGIPFVRMRYPGKEDAADTPQKDLEEAVKFALVAPAFGGK